MHRVHRCLRTLTARVKPAYDEEPGSNATDDAVLHGVPFEGTRELLNSVLGRMFGHGGSALDARQPGPR